MARLPRLTIAGYPHHVILRGNNRQPIFRDTADYRRLLGSLRNFSVEYKVAVHAYVLMTNHAHLLLTPETNEGLPGMMQALGRSYVRYFNDRHERSGTLWEGRYRSGLIEAERYLLACMVYMDLNPVRAGMVAAPADYPWSSHAHYIGLSQDPLVTPHPLYWEMGNTPFAREAAYASLVGVGQTSAQHETLTRAAHSGWALGTDHFVVDLQKRTARRLTPGQAGRPLGISKQVPDVENGDFKTSSQ
ncbi:REP-associated tyrosine transposase [Ottowia thiooxydans]|uniref:REP-associated tyrosine transposase n=1 Tax=Ottowia thiooxydans TaxID=219182 RepID=UPI00041B5EF5|nr:transposase [Ottowia thiooxydans]